MIFSSVLGIEHNLLVYASSPGWSFTDMRGFGASLLPWLWFKLYWAAWALLPARGGIDPYNLLDWEEGDNIEPIVMAEHRRSGG